MALIYFTNNAESGDGSFADALSSSVSGDVIEPSPNVDWGSEVITITLTAAISLGSRVNRTISGGANHRIRFDGQGAAQLFNPSNCNIAFEKCDFVRGYRDSYGAAFNAINANPSLTFRQCMFGGNLSNGSTGNGTLSTNSSTYKFDLTFENCVQYYDAQSMILYTRATSCVYNNCSLVGSTATGNTIEYNNSLRIGTSMSRSNFVNLPPSPGDDSWTNTLWQSCDARQVPGASYLYGNTSALETDFLGRPRFTGGALGAFEGAYVVVNAGQTYQLQQDTTTDYLEVGANATIRSIADNEKILAVTKAAGVDANAQFLASDGSTLYIALADVSEIPATVTLNNAVVCYYGAGLDEFEGETTSANTATLQWTQDNSSVPVLLEVFDGERWTTVNAAAVSPYFVESAENVAGQQYRLFDGELFSTITLSSVPFSAALQYQVVSSIVGTITVDTTWNAISQIVGVVDDMTTNLRTGQACTLLARIYDAFDNDSYLSNDGTNVVSVKYSCEQRKKTLYELEYVAVQGHNNVTVDNSCVLSSVELGDDAWDLDDIGYNFRLVPDITQNPLFSEAGEYRLKVTVQLTSGNPIVFYQQFIVEP